MRAILPLVAVATAIFAKTVVAGLGWTLEECKKHYGEPIRSESHALGLKEFMFSVKDFYVVVRTDKSGKVGLITYIRSSINQELVRQLMEQNASNVAWKPYQISEPGCEAWIGNEKGTIQKKGATPQYLTIFRKGLDRDSVAIGTFQFHIFASASEKQEAKETASGL